MNDLPTKTKIIHISALVLVHLVNTDICTCPLKLTEEVMLPSALKALGTLLLPSWSNWILNQTHPGEVLILLYTRSLPPSYSQYA